MVDDPMLQLPSAKLPAFDGLQSDVWGDERMGLEVRAESRRFLREARLAAAHVVSRARSRWSTGTWACRDCVSLPTKVVHGNRVFV